MDFPGGHQESHWPGDNMILILNICIKWRLVIILYLINFDFYWSCKTNIIQFISDVAVQEGSFSRGRWFRPSHFADRDVRLRLHGQEEQGLRQRQHPHPDLGADPDREFCQHERKSQRTHWIHQVINKRFIISNS